MGKRVTHQARGVFISRLKLSARALPTLHKVNKYSAATTPRREINSIGVDNSWRIYSARMGNLNITFEVRIPLKFVHGRAWKRIQLSVNGIISHLSAALVSNGNGKSSQITFCRE
ncbi:hypothetical protein AVEN_267714-1 [Araneus ventricosus]|uniref:Uncharacterized protein n=1 Tax=Araneus ventricosus TaxID=182803 RepID=A0A4Y2CVD3_ARAVE|nr:hypothetical protein AVEN_267714-1 [Araneus ventricosus]